ncbi:protein CURVATURE THYLAKOID 1D, chloroplastic [Cajanus cajan]|uniref:protein CURVATURE THYLAKOID 1D, chloroplastic n=1 Tax=Cajanus cajan TaxID=3821 RepID=UPI00098DB39B|nr:protein CURVATURE THYLAKOID 1D, chloroplastic [Cajanus cajan]
MGLSTLQPITLSKLPNVFPSFPHRQTLLTPHAALLSRSICLRNLSARATTSEERSNGASPFFNEKRDGVITLEDVKADDRNEFDKTGNEDTKEVLPVDGEDLSFNLLDKINFDKDDAGSVVLYGAGAIVTLWLTSAVIGAIDSIPLFPKLLEVVGLAYTVWFSSRYLLFKQNRDELSVKIEELKEQIFGSEDN